MAIHRLTWIAVILFVMVLFASRSAQAGTVYIGNSLTVPNGAPDGAAKSLVILGEYSPAGPLAAGSSATTLHSGTVQDVPFYGQNYNFTLYALSLVAAGPNPNEQTFQVVASQSFSNSVASARIQTLPVSGFFVNAGQLLAFAGTGPYYPQNTTNDATHSDATYYNVSGYLPPGAPGSQFSVGINGDSSAEYEYIGDNFGNQGRTYGIGVHVAETAAGTWTPLANLAPGNVGVMLLLSDGTVMCSCSDTSSDWFRLTPDQHGSYANGTWSKDIASMHYSRLFFASDVLPDGTVFVAGGEYGTGSTHAEIYHPVANNWTVIDPPSSLYNPNNGDTFGDCLSVVIANGNVLTAS